jgi:hypothetical protein
MTEVNKSSRKRKEGLEKSEEWTVMWCDTVDETEACISDSEIIWPIIHQTIVRLLNEERTSLPALEIRCGEMIGSIWITVRREEVRGTLDKELQWRLNREEYEECVEIKELIDSLEVPSSVKKSADLD